MRLRLVTYNIRKGGGRRAPLIAGVLRQLDPDMVILQEAVNPAFVGDVARAIDSRVIAGGPGRSVAVISRLDGLEATWHRPRRGPGFAEVAIAAANVRVIGVHLTAGLSGRGERRRIPEMAHVLAVADADPGQGRVVIAGDLNAVAPGDLPALARLPAWIRILLRVDGGIATTVVARALEAGFVDAFRSQHPDLAGATIPSAAPSVRLDYFLLSPEVAPGALSCSLAGADPRILGAASDHLPLVLDLDTAPDRTAGVSVAEDVCRLADVDLAPA